MSATVPYVDPLKCPISLFLMGKLETLTAFLSCILHVPQFLQYKFIFSMIDHSYGSQIQNLSSSFFLSDSMAQWSSTIGTHHKLNFLLLQFNHSEVLRLCLKGSPFEQFCQFFSVLLIAGDAILSNWFLEPSKVTNKYQPWNKEML